MEHNLQIFTNEEFGKVRVVMIDGEPWFVAADACRILEINNPSQALTRLDDDEKNTLILNEGNRGNPNVNVVNEPGLYRLIFASRKPEAKNFQRWIYHEVLPSIRKTGSYSLNAQPANSARRDAQLKLACVYVLLMSNGIVKIGYSGKLRSRVAKIENQTGLTVHDIYFTPFTSREIARFVEWVCQKKFSSRKVEGEFFSVDFNEACTAVEDFFAKAVHAFSSVMKFERSAAIDF